jgi:Reverse transcriptase (RNA-dependent DNA polymerase).
VKRLTEKNGGQKTNLINSKWVFKRKTESNGDEKFRVRLVIRGFKDTNIYELRETYAPVSRIALVKTVIAIINKYNLDVIQLDVKTAFLHGVIDEEIYMEIPEGSKHTDERKERKRCAN